MISETENLRQRIAELETENAQLREKCDLYTQTIEDMSARESEERLQTVIDNMPMMMVAVDANSRIILWNRECERVTGYSAEEMIGRSDFMELLYPDDAYRASLMAEAGRRSGEYRGWEMELTCKDGSRKTLSWFNVSRQHPVKGWDRWTLSVDVTPRVQAEREIRRLNTDLERRVEERTAEFEEVNRALQDQIVESLEAQELIQRYADEITDLYNNAPCCYYSLDPSGVFIRVNDTLLDMLGYTREEVIGRMTIFDLYAPQEKAAAAQRFAALGNDGVVHDIETSVLHKDGTSLPVLINSSVIYDEKGQFVRTRSTMVNMSELKKAQNIIVELNHHLEERARMLESANKELEAFSYSVSHDLRAPLRAIDGFSRVVLESYGDMMSEQGQHYLRRVRDNAGRMGQLIDDLLNFSRIGRRPMTKTTVSPQQIARQVVAEIREQQPERQVEIVVHEMPPCIADGPLLKQVYANLIENAVKFSREKPNPRVEVGSEQIGGELIFYVKDNGVGFDMEYVGKIFGVFQRLHSLAEYEGTGVGLATVQRIIHRHGGRVWVEAAVNEGARFYFTLGRY